MAYATTITKCPQCKSRTERICRIDRSQNTSWHCSNRACGGWIKLKNTGWEKAKDQLWGMEQ